MQLLSAQNLGLSFADRTLFHDLNFRVETGWRIGLTGHNGTGKTSLLRIITGEYEASQGQLVYSSGCQLAYMEQVLDSQSEHSLYKYVEQVFAPLLQIEQRLAELSHLLSSAASDALLDEQSRLQERYEAGGGYTYRSRLRATLLGLGFEELHFQLPIAALSGGQRSKAALAKVLLSEANLLLLDEPTNHLDIASIQWLEGFLTNLRSAVIVISHDRYFLDRVTNHTWQLQNGQLHCSKGNYSRHLELRESEQETISRRYQNQRREIRRIESIIAQQRRFNQARNYVTIASKEKQLARLQADLVAPEQEARTLSFHFNTPPPGGNDVLELHQVSKGFGAKTLFRGVDLRLFRGERVFLLGANGVGKTTLMKIILGQLPPDEGMVRLGVNILPAYYDQHHDQISGNRSILDYFTDAYPRLTQTQIRTMLGRFLFPAEAVEKTLDMLSGGEKARLELMKLILAPANLLLLDEPTNHLDIASMEAVEQALLDYPGTMLVVSHDRYLINKLADRIYYLQPDGMLEVVGNYDDLLEQQRNNASQAADSAASTATAEQDYRQRKESQAQARRRERQLSQAEERLAQLEQQLEQLDAAMLQPEIATDYQQLMALQAEKEGLEADYLACLEEIEQLQTAAQE